eukprot:gnl/Trimastix_PCT/3926.p1 GENE.gnl/Trimastix_PCT/3926~~gnl/Trimastix_PCT/3926.p1  ORF type:complete len:234 (-),score=43.68 gnl/Trimastix_PCT/3926:104-805(-)
MSNSSDDISEIDALINELSEPPLSLPKPKPTFPLVPTPRYTPRGTNFASSPAQDSPTTPKLVEDELDELLSSIGDTAEEDPFPVSSSILSDPSTESPAYEMDPYSNTFSELPPAERVYCSPAPFLAGSVNTGCSTPQTTMICDELRCTSCDFRVKRFIDNEWSRSVDGLFFRNNIFHEDKLRERLVHRAGSAAYACQCTWTTAGAPKIINYGERGIKWVCGGHTPLPEYSDGR